MPPAFAISVILSAMPIARLHNAFAAAPLALGLPSLKPVNLTHPELSVLEGLKMAHQKGPQSHNQITILKRQKYGTAGKTEKVERPVAYKFRFEVLEVEPAKTKNVKTKNVDAQKQTNLDSKH